MILDRFSFLFALVAFSSAAWADVKPTPSVGDRVEYDVTRTKGSNVIHQIVTKEFKSYDSGYFDVEVDVIENGRIVSTSVKKQIKATLLLQILVEDSETCEELGGTPETLSTPAGTFDACAHPLNKDPDTEEPAHGTLWNGAFHSYVPFGIVKQTLTYDSGETVTLSLRSFHSVVSPVVSPVVSKDQDDPASP